MIKSLILYFLSIKPTHGYEIQKYVQLNQMNDWTKIQSGSIYYALSKLEKDGLIQLQAEENISGKVRKIYCITEKGKEELKDILIEQISKPIYNIKSDKFVAYPFIKGIKKELLLKAIKKHIVELEQKKKEIKRWENIKINHSSLDIEKISFEMMISSIDYQIKWHRALILEIDKYIQQSEKIGEFIRNVDFSEVNDINDVYTKFNK